MPRPVPPPPSPELNLAPFTLPKEDYKDIAVALGLPWLPPTAVETIEYEIAAYKTFAGAPDETTPRASIAAIDAVLKAEKALERALRPFIPTGSASFPWQMADYERSGLDEETFDAGSPIAVQYRSLGGQMRAVLMLRQDQLSEHPPVNPRSEKLSFTCSRLRFFFIAMDHGNRDDALPRLHTFLISILETAGLNRKKCDTYRNQPQRLDELCTADGGIPPDKRPIIADNLRSKIDEELSKPQP